MSRCHVRCANRQCDARRVLAKHPDDYQRKPVCLSCGGTKFYVSHWMNRRNTRNASCSCRGYMWCSRGSAWSHRMGSKYCWYRKDGTQRMPGDADFHDYEYERMENEGRMLYGTR